MIEDKKIVVTFGSEEGILTINKVDEETNEPLKGAEFEIAPKGEDITGYLNRGATYYFPYNSQPNHHG
jgi:hypothetical protein